MKTNMKMMTGALFTMVAFTACAKKATIEISEEDIAAAQAAIAAIQAGASAGDVAAAIQEDGANVSGLDLSGSGDGVGQFSGATDNIGISAGFVLSTGHVEDLFQSADNNASSGTSGASADAALVSIAPNGTSLYDASIVTFDVVPTGNTLDLIYVFGSEEYPEYACSSFNDIFGIFVSGPNPAGGSYSSENIALIPGTSSPVSINTINPGQCAVDSTLYTDNAGLAADSIVLDGMTHVMHALATVTPGETYHIKIAIADAGDQIMDSAVFVGNLVSSYNLD